MINKKYEKYLKLIGKQIKNTRKEKRMKLQDLSGLTGIRAEYLKKIEEGKATGMRICKHLSVTAKALNVKLYNLFDF